MKLFGYELPGMSSLILWGLLWCLWGCGGCYQISRVSLAGQSSPEERAIVRALFGPNDGKTEFTAGLA